MQLKVIQLKQKIDCLEDLFGKILQHLSEQDSEAYSSSVEEYREVKKEILLSLFEAPIHQTDTQHFSDVRQTLQRLTLNGDPYLPDKSNNSKDKEIIEALYRDLDIKLTNQEYDELGWEHFYSWFSGEEYAEALIKSQLLILHADGIPKELSHFVEEIRSCYAFQNYTAAFSLCRTLLEVAVRDIYKVNKLNRYNTKFAEPTVEYFLESNKWKKDKLIENFSPDLFDYIEILAKLAKFEHLIGDLHCVRNKGNSVIHAEEVGSKESATVMIRKTFNVIHNLYEAN